MPSPSRGKSSGCRNRFTKPLPALQKLLVGSTAICVALLGYWSDYRVRQSAEALLLSAWKDTSGVGCPLFPGIDARRRLIQQGCVMGTRTNPLALALECRCATSLSR